MPKTDDFLGGRVRLIQEKEGLRATSDSVLVAAAVPAKANESILDVGVGNGVIPVCLNARVPNLKITGIDCQENLLELANQNAELNQCQLTPIGADIQKKPSPIHGKQFHHVVTNPPFYDEPQKRQNRQQTIAYHQRLTLTEWIDFCLRHVRAKGTLTLICRTEALTEILPVLSKKLGNLELFPIASKPGEPAKRMIIRGKMNSRSPLKLYSPLVMHTPNGERSQVAEEILRHGKGLDNLLGLDI